MSALITSIMLMAIVNFPLKESSGMIAHPVINSPDLSGNSDESFVFPSDDFTGSFEMEITEMKKGKPSKNGPVKIKYYFEEDQVAFLPEIEGGQSPKMIFNTKDNTVTTLIDQGGQKLAMKMKAPKLKAKVAGDEDNDYKVEPTNEKKTIEGYTCRKYLFDSKDYSGHAWITEDFVIDYERLLGMLNVDKKATRSNVPSLDDIEGFAMESYMEHKRKDQAHEMKVTNVKVGEVDKSVFDLSGYTVTDMGDIGNMGGFGGQD